MIKVILAATMIAAVSPVFGFNRVVTGQAAFTDWNQQKPGIRRKITIADLPAPAPQGAVSNGPHIIPRPTNAWPVKRPAGFKVTLYAEGRLQAYPSLLLAKRSATQRTRRT